MNLFRRQIVTKPVSHDHFQNQTFEKDKPVSLSDLKSLHPTVFLMCTRSKNRNIVVYDLNVNPDGCIQPDIPVSGYWLILDPPAIDVMRNSKIFHNREELSVLDTTFAWGFHASRLSNRCATFSFKSFPQHVFDVKLNDKGVANAFLTLHDKRYYVHSIHVVGTDNISLSNLHNNVKSISIQMCELSMGKLGAMCTMKLYDRA